MLIGSTVESSHGGIDSALQIIGTGTDDSIILLCPDLVMIITLHILFNTKSRNGSIGGNTVVQDDDSIGRITILWK